MSDNRIVYIAKAFAQQARLDEASNEVRRTLGPDVVSFRCSLGQDWSGDSAIFFRIVLSDRASRCDQLRSAADRIENTVMQRLQAIAWHSQQRSTRAVTRSRETAWSPAADRRTSTRINPLFCFICVHPRSSAPKFHSCSRQSVTTLRRKFSKNRPNVFSPLRVSHANSIRNSKYRAATLELKDGVRPAATTDPSGIGAAYEPGPLFSDLKTR